MVVSLYSVSKFKKKKKIIRKTPRNKKTPILIFNGEDLFV